MGESSSRFPARQSEQIFEYLFVIALEGVKKEVAEVKHHLYNLLEGTYPGYKSTPHITLFNISSDERMNNILELLNISWMPPFKIRIKGFDYYQHGQKSRTLYLNIENKQSIVYLQKWLTHFFRLRKHTYDPHITIGRTLPVPMFDKAWQNIKEISFDRELVCDQLVILKRKQQLQHPEKWEEFKSIPLGVN